MRLIVGITGASGSIYGIRLLEVLSKIESIETHLVISKPGERTIEYETGWKVNQVKSLAKYVYEVEDIGASLASGSFKTQGMVIIPCTVKTMSAIAHSYNTNLMIRAADVVLKERRRLILVLRESPLHLGHIRSMQQVTEMGAIILPPVPAFYNKPQSLDDIINHTVARVLDLFGVEHGLIQQWKGMKNQ